SDRSSPAYPNVFASPPLPRPPWPSRQRKISDSPEQTPPNVGGLPQSQPFFQPSFSNQATLCSMFETLTIGISRFASMSSALPMVAALFPPGRATRPPSSAGRGMGHQTDRQRRRQGNDHRGVGDPDHQPLSTGDRVVARNRMPPALPQREQPDRQHQQQQGRAGHDQRHHTDRIAGDPERPAERAGDTATVERRDR